MQKLQKLFFVITASIFLAVASGCAVTGGPQSTAPDGKSKTRTEVYIPIRLCPCLDLTVVNNTPLTWLVEADYQPAKYLRPGHRYDVSYHGYSSDRKEVAVFAYEVKNRVRTGEVVTDRYRLPRRGQERETWHIGW